MIGKIAGRVDYKTTDHALIDVRGVGYIVFLSERALMTLKPGEAASFYTEMIVREDAMTLYGFSSLVEKEWFRLLLAVQGVGAKAATAILGALGPDGVSRAIALGDWNAAQNRAARGDGTQGQGANGHGHGGRARTGARRCGGRDLYAGPYACVRYSAGCTREQRPARGAFGPDEPGLPTR